MLEMIIGVAIFVVGTFFGAVLYGCGVKAGESNGKTED